MNSMQPNDDSIANLLSESEIALLDKTFRYLETHNELPVHFVLLKKLNYIAVKCSYGSANNKTKLSDNLNMLFAKVREAISILDTRQISYLCDKATEPSEDIQSPSDTPWDITIIDYVAFIKELSAQIIANNIDSDGICRLISINGKKPIRSLRAKAGRVLSGTTEVIHKRKKRMKE